MNDERFLKDWLRDTTDERSDAHAAAEHIVARLPRTRQRSRWWPLLPRRRRSPSEDRTTNLEGRTRLMLSPTKAIAAGALVFLTGGLLLVAAPIGTEPAGVPGAQVSADTPPSLFHGRVLPAWTEVTLESAVAGTRDDGSTFEYGSGWVGSSLTTNDPRMGGRLDWMWNGDEPPVADPPAELTGGIGTVLVRVANDGGTWTGSTTWMSLDDPDWESLSGWLTGAGGYEGLMAYVAMDANDYEVMGYITPYGPPPVPEGFPRDSET